MIFGDDNLFPYDSFGALALDSMRLPSNAIALKRQELQDMLDNLDGHLLLNRQDHSLYKITKQRPQSDMFDEWMYEIDLDRNIFHINGFPFFSLECLPDTHSFLEYVTESRDHYGHLTCPPTCPPKQKYKRSPPPAVDDFEVATYQSLVCTGAQVALSDLLAISDALSPDERVRVSLLESLIGQCMTVEDVANAIHDLLFITGPGQLTDALWLAASSIANFAFIPQIFNDFVDHPELRLGQEFTWVRKDTVLYISTHLHNEQCLQAAISRLIDVILEQAENNIGDFFGIAFSVFHCAIVKVVKDEHTTTFSHTIGFEFLPSFYADSPSTPGITALARLGYRIDPELFERVTNIFSGHIWTEFEYIDDEDSLVQKADDTPPRIGRAELPLELWREVALHLQLPDLLTLGLVSKLCREAASMVLRYPHICGYRLVAVAEEKPDFILQDYHFLRASCYVAEQFDVLTSIVVGELSESWGEEERICIPFGYTYEPFVVRCSVKENMEASQELASQYAF